MFLRRDGNVGIGTTSPAEKLHIRDDSTDADVYIKIANDSRDWFMGVEGSNSDILSFKTHDASNLLNITSGGNVGIGTNTPEEKLVVMGDIGFGAGGYNGGIYANNTGSASGVDSNWGLEVQRTSGVDDYNTRLKYYPSNGSTRKAGIWSARDDYFTIYSDGDFVPNVIIPSGNVGIGTTSPSAKLEVESSSNPEISIASTAGATSNYLNFKATSHSQPIQSQIKAEDNGNFTADMVFSFKGTGTSGALAEKMRITSGGGLIVGAAGVGDVNNIVNTHLIEGNSQTAGIAPTGFYNNSGTANVPVVNILQRDTSTDSSCRFIQFFSSVTNAAGQSMGGIVGNGANNAQFAIISDIREKENIKTIESSLDKINKLNPVEFDWKKTGEHTKAGFIAQEVEEIFPEYVVENLSNEGEEERKGLTGGMTSGIVAHLVKSIQELKADNDSLKARIETLENK
jgi:hypothetical protein